MKILFFHEVNYLTKPIYEFQEFPEGLAGLGHDVGVVHFPEGTKRSVSDKYSSKGVVIRGRVSDEVSITLFTPKTLSGSLVGRLVYAFTGIWHTIRVIRNYRPDVIVCFAVPTNGWQALLVSKITGTPFVFRALDVSHLIRPGWFSQLVKLAEKIIYKWSTSVSANNPRMLKYCMERAGRRLDGAVHLPPLELEVFARGIRADGRERLGISQSARVILYLGSFFHFSGLDRCIEELARNRGNAILVLIGGGLQARHLKSLAADLGVSDRVIFTGFMPFNELPDLVAASDVAINPMIKSLVSDCALPHKVLQYIASGIPVVSSSLEGLQGTLGENSGVSYQDTPEAVMSEAMMIAASPSLQTAMRETQRERLYEVFAKDPVKEFEYFLNRWRSS